MGILANLLFGGGADKDVDIKAMVESGALVVDTRSPGEFSHGHIEGAFNIPYNVIAGKIGALTEDKSKPIIVYCHSGARSGAAKHALEKAGYTNTINGGSLHRMRKLLAQ